MIANKKYVDDEVDTKKAKTIYLPITTFRDNHIVTPLNTGGAAITGANDRASTTIVLPSDLTTITKITFWGYSNVAETDGMVAGVYVVGGADNEARDNHNFFVTDVTTTTNFAVNDNVKWEITSADSAVLSDFTAGDYLTWIEIRYNAEISADCATNAQIGGILIEYE